MQEISVHELKKLIDEKADFQLIDVREPSEFEMANIGGKLIPLASVPDHLDEIDPDKMVVVHCRSGKRSANAIMYLEQQGFENLYNLQGGIMAWAAEIDKSMHVS